MTTRRMDVYDPPQQISSWIDGYTDDITCPNMATPLLEVDQKILANQFQSEYNYHGMLSPSSHYEQGTSKCSEKAQRRLAQNREAARKSRIRKKAYVQQLELSRLKLVQLEQQLQAERARQQVHPTRTQMMQVDTGIREFEKEYGEWMEQQKKLICEMRVALQSHDDGSVRIVVERWMKQYSDLFGMKSNAAKSDVFYLMSGMWKSPVERLFFWLGGFRPSDLLKVVIPVIEELSEKQRMDVCNLEHSCQQAEDALSQGMERLHHTLAGTVAIVEDEGEGSNSGSWLSSAVERLDALVSFVNQADHLRQETLQQMRRILTIRQAGTGLLVLAEYFHRLIALSSLWPNHPP